MMPELGKYAATVLAAWGVTLGLLALLVVVSVWRAGRVKRALQAQQERMRKNG